MTGISDFTPQFFGPFGTSTMAFGSSLNTFYRVLDGNQWEGGVSSLEAYAINNVDF